MKSLFLQIVATVLGLAALSAMEPCFGEDYLIIKKKSGGVERVPLPFAPDEIESFQVEAAAPYTAALTKPPAAAMVEQETAPPPPPVRRTNGRSAIYRRSRRATVTLRGSHSHSTHRDARKGESQFFEPSTPISSPTTAPIPGGKRSFTVSLYKLLVPHKGHSEL